MYMGHYNDIKYKTSECVFVDALRRISKVLNDLNLKYWLSFGTLLGYIREQHFINGDSDMDFGMTSESFDILEKNKHLIYEQGFKIVENKFNTRGKWRDMFIYDENIKNFHIDISEWRHDYKSNKYTFRWQLRLNLPSKIFDVLYKLVVRQMKQLNDKQNVFRTDFNRYKRVSLLKLISIVCFEIDWFFNTKRQFEIYLPYVIPTTYYGIKTFIPAYPHTLCKINYGKNYMTPDDKFRGGGREYIKGKTSDGFERCWIDD
jgi:hypothetical protein